MRLRPATLAFLLLAAGAAGAEEQGSAPLESSKQALKALKADETAKNSAVTAGKLADGLPQVETPVPGATPLEFSQLAKPDRSEKAQQRKKDAQKNWLLDGVDKLGRDTKTKGRTAAGGDQKDVTDEDEEKPDSTDPDYLLKVYAEQKKEEAAKAEARQAAHVRSDPIAPFLQGWMGNSPVRGSFSDEFAKKPEGGAGPLSTAPQFASGGAQLPGNPVAGDSNRPGAAPVTAQPNPYLQGFDYPGLADAGASRLNQTVAAPLTFGAPASSPAIPAIDPVPAGRPAEKKPPFLAPSDNEKYFPQQKKF